MNFPLSRQIHISLIAAMLLCSCNDGDSKIARAFLNLHDSVKYVGMQECRSCHESIYRSFIRTGMGQSFGIASGMRSSADSVNALIHDAHKNLRYHMFWENDSMYVKEFRTDDRDTIFQRTEKVDYIVGSGQHTNSHIMSRNGFLTQMPATYYTQDGRWDLPPGFEDGRNSRFEREIGLECMSCHNAYPEFTKGSENKYSNVPSGIDCERCHGPGELHIAQKKAGNLVDISKDIDYSIVNPGKLSVELQFDVCQRCHLQGNSVLKKGKSYFDFRPGMKLSDIFTVFLPKYSNDDDHFIMASHVDRLKMSKCYLMSTEGNKGQENELFPYKNSLTCVTCHNPHVSVKETADFTFNASCRKCHESGDKSACPKIVDVDLKDETNCISCHMPRSSSIDIPHVTITDHYIRKPVSDEKKEEIKKFVGLISINEAKPESIVIARAYIAQYEKFEENEFYLDSARKYIRSDSKLQVQQNFCELVHLAFLRGNYFSILKYLDDAGLQYVSDNYLTQQSWDNNGAWTAYRIGEAFMNGKQYKDASYYFGRAIKLAPNVPKMLNKHAASIFSMGNLEEAKKAYQSVLLLDPKNVLANSNLGYIYFLERDFKLAGKLLNQALDADPDNVSAMMNMVALHYELKEFNAAYILIKHVLELEPNNSKAINILDYLATSK